MKILVLIFFLLLNSNSFAAETTAQKIDKNVQAAVDEAVEGGKKVVRKMKKATNAQTDEQVAEESKKKDLKE